MANGKFEEWGVRLPNLAVRTIEAALAAVPRSCGEKWFLLHIEKIQLAASGSKGRDVWVNADVAHPQIEGTFSIRMTVTHGPDGVVEIQGGFTDPPEMMKEVRFSL